MAFIQNTQMQDNKSQKHHFNFVEYLFLNQQFKRHFHTSYSMGLILQGVHKLHINGKDLVAKCGTIKIVNPYEIHLADGKTSWRYANFMPNTQTIKDIAMQMEDSYINSPIKFHNNITDKRAVKYFYKLYLSSIDANSKLLFEESMIVFISYLLDHFTYTKIDTKDISSSIQNAVDYIHANFLQDISLEDLCKEVNISKYHLIRIFKKQRNFTPHQYILILRIEHAQKLIANGQNLSQIASICGFSDQSHFIKTYKNYFGFTPSKNFL